MGDLYKTVAEKYVEDHPPIYSADAMDRVLRENQELQKQNEELIGLIYECRAMQWARSSEECSNIYNEVEEKLKQIKGE